MKNPDLLWEYQCFEQKKAKLQKELKALAEIHELRKLKEEIEQSQEVIRSLSQEMEKIKSAIKTREDELLPLREKLTNAEAELYGGNIHASREIAASEKNISVIKQKIEEQENSELAALEKLEQTEARLKPLLTALQEKKNLFRRVNQDYSNKKAKLVGELDEIRSRQDTLILNINQDEWEFYSNLCEKYPDKCGFGILQSGICTGCHMTVSYEQLKKAKDTTVIVCDNCGRYLIVR